MVQMKSTILLLGEGALARLDSVRAIKALGHSVMVVQPLAAAQSADARRVEHQLFADLTNLDSTVVAVVEYCLAHDIQIAAVASFSEFCVEHAAVLADVFGVRGAGVTAVRTCRNKYLARYACRALTDCMPRFRLVRRAEDVRRFMEDVDGPVIAKPLNTAASFGVVKIATLDEVEDKFSVLAGSSDPQLDAIMGGTMIKGCWLAEEYIDGFEISAESYTIDGQTRTIAIHDKLEPVEEPHFLEQYFVTPSPRVDSALEESVKAITADVLGAIGFRNGITHVEFRVKGGRPYVIEVNPRPGGGLVVDSVYYSTGVNLVEAGIRLLLGEEIADPARRDPVVVRSVFPDEGTIESIVGLEELETDRDINVLDVKCEVGDFVKTRGINAEINLLASSPQRTIDELLALVDSKADSIVFTCH